MTSTAAHIKPTMDVIAEFRAAMSDAGLITDAEIIADGTLHRFHVEGDRRGDDNGWYVLHLDGVPAGAFGCWKRNISAKWSSKADHQMTPTERTEYRRRLEAINAERERARREAQDKARRRAESIWGEALPVVAHPYLQSKGIKPHGVRRLDDALVVPLTDADGNIHSLQFIAAGGRKTFLTDSAIRRHYFLIGKPDGVLCIAEGYATAASVHEATGHAVAVAFNAGNLEPVAQAVRKKYPGIRLILCADNDAWTEGNPGLTKAREAAHAVGAILAVPEFRDVSSKPTDFNDMAQLEGAEVVRRIIAAALNKATSDQRGHVTDSPTGVNLVDDTEDGFALAFAQKYAGELLYDHSSGSWYRWTGTHWKREETRLAFHWARELCRKLNVQRKPRLSSVATAAAVERFAQADPHFAVTADRFDANPWLLGTPGGVIDLRSGTLREARREYITKQSAVEPAPVGIVPTLWLQFLAEACGGDGELVAFLKRIMGYALTGDIREHALLFVYGPGGNGKSVFLNTVSRILGDYAVTAPMDTFTAARGEHHPTDLAMLRGARLVTASETEEGRAWAEARIKSVTGGDPITARFMRRDFFTFIPQFKLVITGNYKPILRNVDDAVRRRFHIIPFTRKPATVDRELEQKLVAEWPAILRWMLEGCAEWQRQGLAPPAVVRDATQGYFDDQDLFGHWLEDACDLGEQRRASHAELFRSWSQFAEANGDAPGSAKAFTEMMRKRGFESVRKIGGQSIRGFRGLSLKLLDIGTDWGSDR